MRASLLLASSLLCCATGCALGTAAPAGPIAGPGIKVTNAWGYNYAPVAFSEDVDGDPQDDTLNAGLPPLDAGLRASLGTWFDMGMNVSLRDVGFAVRGGPLDAERELPFGLELQFQRGTTNDRRGTERAAARFEAYPSLGKTEATRRYGVLALGMSYGDQPFLVDEMPDAYGTDPFDERGGLIRGPELDFAMRELRVEAFVGGHLRFAPGILTVGLAPHWAVTSTPDKPYGVIGGAQHGWGVMLLIVPGFTWEGDAQVRTSALPQ